MICIIPAVLFGGPAIERTVEIDKPWTLDALSFLQATDPLITWRLLENGKPYKELSGNTAYLYYGDSLAADELVEISSTNVDAVAGTIDMQIDADELNTNGVFAAALILQDAAARKYFYGETELSITASTIGTAGPLPLVDADIAGLRADYTAHAADDDAHQDLVTLGDGSDPALSRNGQELTLADVATQDELEAWGLDDAANVNSNETVNMLGITLTNINLSAYYDSDEVDTLLGGYVQTNHTGDVTINGVVTVAGTDTAGIVFQTAGIAGNLVADLAGDLYASPDGIAAKLWHANNDGSGSGLDADTVDGAELGTAAYSNATDFATGAEGDLAATALQDVSDDASPTLGGDLDADGYSITDADELQGDLLSARADRHAIVCSQTATIPAEVESRFVYETNSVLYVVYAGEHTDYSGIAVGDAVWLQSGAYEGVYRIADKYAGSTDDPVPGVVAGDTVLEAVGTVGDGTEAAIDAPIGKAICAVAHSSTYARSWIDLVAHYFTSSSIAFLTEAATIKIYTQTGDAADCSITKTSDKGGLEAMCYIDGTTAFVALFNQTASDYLFAVDYRIEWMDIRNASFQEVTTIPE